MKQKFKAIDLFAGAGGFSLAAKQAGMHLIGALELDAHSCATYKNNLIKKNDKTTLVQKDITKLSPTKFMELLDIESGICDLLLGGPPCQGFSFLRTKTIEEDPRNKLLWRYFKYLQAISPKMFLVENVPGMLWVDNKVYIEQFYRMAEKAGYHVYAPTVLDAKNFGVPQTRKRVFIYGVRKDQMEMLPHISWPPMPTHGDPLSDAVKEGRLKPWVAATDIFTNSCQAEDPNNVHMQHSKELIAVFKSTPLNGGSRSQSNRVLPCHKTHNGHKDVYGRIDMSRPGPTMTTSCTNPSKGRFVHPTQHHGITVRQAARFQTFPDDFIFSGGLIAASRQVGNAVPIKLGKVIIQHIAQHLNAGARQVTSHTESVSAEALAAS